ncbi:alpha/beta fold hydrolase [Legionella sp. D16C41]|uniref:alpha/beta fold hydrolase n=1 Tax=Legionella sp. D16C41 TaxID=3402688 RepID=UPI003AF54815
MKTVFAKYLLINGRKINCKVLAADESFASRPYLLCIPGGPGFGLASTEAFTNQLEKQAKALQIPLPNVILFDPLGCDSSDTANDIDEEYSMYNFTEIAANVVENVKEELCPNQPMDLRVYGGSFGSLTAMDIPLHRPQWVINDATIHLKQIISLVGPNGAGEKEYSRQYLEDNFKHHPNYHHIKLALNKLLDGKIQDKDDYIQSIVINLAPLYSEENEKLLNSYLGKLLRNYHRQLIPIMKGINYLIKKIGLSSDKLDYMIMGLDGCSLEVLNQFFKTDMNGFNLTDNISKNLSLYNQIPISLISCINDHMVNYKTAEGINQLLPNSSAAIILNDKHMATKGPSKDTVEKIILGMLTSKIPEQALASPQINHHTVTANFQQQIELLNNSNKENALANSTKMLFSTLGLPKQNVVVSDPNVTRVINNSSSLVSAKNDPEEDIHVEFKMNLN